MHGNSSIECSNVKFLFFYKQFVIIPTYFDLSWLSSGGTEHQHRIHKKSVSRQNTKAVLTFKDRK